MKYLFTLVSLLFILPSWAQQAPSVRSKLATDTIMIGDQITMEIEVEKDIATEILIPQFEKGQLTKEIEVLGLPRLDTLERDGRQMKLRLSYLITSFDAGNYILEGFPIVWEKQNEVFDTVYSADKLSLVVQTFDIDTTKQQIADIKPPIQTPLKWVEIKEIVLYSALGAVVLGVIIYFLIRYFKTRKRKELVKPKEPAHITAIRSLEQLIAKKLPEAGLHKEFYTELTDILRTYMNGRYGIWAMEMTTPQIMDAIKEVNDDKQVKKLGELFSLADIVKFAKWRPSVDVCNESYNTAYYYIEETKILIIKQVSEDA